MSSVKEIKRMIQELELNEPEYGKGKAYAQLPDEFSDTPHYRSIKNRLDFILEHHQDWNCKVIDLGCSTGHYCFELAKLGAECTGIDYNQNCIKVAKAITNLKNSNTTFHYSNAYDYTPTPTKVLLHLSVFQWLAKQKGIEKAREHLEAWSHAAKTIFFETSGSDSAAGLSQANNKQWIDDLLYETGWKVLASKKLKSETGGERWIYHASSRMF